MAEALLAITDRRRDNSIPQAIVKAYNTIRGRASKQVKVRCPRSGSSSRSTPEVLGARKRTGVRATVRSMGACR